MDLSARFLKPVIAKRVHDIFRTAWAHILPKNPEEAASVLLAVGKRTRPEVSSDRSRRASYQRQHRSIMNQGSRQSQKMSQSSAVSSWTKKPAPQDPLTLAPLEQPPVVIGAEPVPESELPSPVLEHRNLSVLERCITLRIVYGRSYS